MNPTITYSTEQRGPMPQAPLFTGQNYVINATVDPAIMQEARAVASASTKDHLLYKNALNFPTTRIGLGGTGGFGVASVDQYMPNELYTCRAGEIAVVPRFDPKHPKKGYTPKFRNGVRHERACVPVRCTIADANAPGTNATTPDTLKAMIVAEQYEFACIIKEVDSVADQSGNTTGAVSGNMSWVNVGYEPIYQGQLIEFFVPTEEELARSSASDLSRDGLRPVFLPRGVDWTKHDLTYWPLYKHYMEELSKKLTANRVYIGTNEVLQYVDDANLALVPYEKTLLKLLTAQAPNMAVADAIGAANNAKTENADKMPSDTFTMHARLLHALRELMGHHDRRIFALAMETMLPGQTGLIQLVKYV